MTELPSVYQSIFYVYFHTDPETGEIVYVGKGSRGRAWHCAESNSRGKEHALWMTDLIKRGFTPDSWVTIVESGLTKEKAFALENDLTWGMETFPKFNSKHDFACKLNDEDLSKALLLRNQNLSYDKIAKTLNVSTMTIYRVLNGQTKNYK